MADIESNPTTSTPSIIPDNSLLQNLTSSSQPDPESTITLTAGEISDDEDDQIQDYRFLLKNGPSSSSSSQQQHLLPRRGEKDFEPHGTLAQSSTLAASQAAMHEALSHERIHGPGLTLDISDPASSASHLIGFFNAETSLTFIPKQTGVWFRTMGRAVKGGSGGALLEPEEALFLCERGTLDLRFGSQTNANADADAELCSLQGLPMSLQAAYACCIGARGLTLEQYIVYAGLKRAGYTVFRANQSNNHYQSSPTPTSPVSLQSWFQSLLGNIFTSEYRAKPGHPLIGSSFFRDYKTIYTRLSIIPTHETSSPGPISGPALTPTFHAYRPSTLIRKTNLPQPDFYIVVLDARGTYFPTASQISALLHDIPPPTKQATTAKSTSTPAAAPVSGTTAAVPLPPPSKPYTPNLYARLKNGRQGKNVLLAVVDCGLVSYVRVCEGGFAEEKVWVGNVGGMAGARSKKGGGGGGGRGGGKRGGRRGRG